MTSFVTNFSGVRSSPVNLECSGLRSFRTTFQYMIEEAHFTYDAHIVHQQAHMLAAMYSAGDQFLQHFGNAHTTSSMAGNFCSTNICFLLFTFVLVG